MVLYLLESDVFLESLTKICNRFFADGRYVSVSIFVAVLPLTLALAFSSPKVNERFQFAMSFISLWVKTELATTTSTIASNPFSLTTISVTFAKDIL